VACVSAGIIVIVLVAVINFFSRIKYRTHFYKEAVVKANYKFIEADSYVLKTNRFGDIIKNDFLVLRDGAVKITGGIMKYNVDEHIVFCDCLIEGTSNSGKKCRPFPCNAILHLHKISVSQNFKVHLAAKAISKCPAIFDDLKFSFHSEGFCLCSDIEIKANVLSPAFIDALKEYKNRFPFARLNQRGLLILNDKGWFILSVPAAGKNMMESLMEFDRRMAEVFLKKHV
jgi:hypothetical protein